MRLLVVSSASVGLILFAAFVVSRLMATRTQGISVRLQVFLALGLIVGTFSLALGWIVVDRIEARAARLAQLAADEEVAVLSGLLVGELLRSQGSLQQLAERLEQERLRGAPLRFQLESPDGRRLYPHSREASVDEALLRVRASLRVRGKIAGYLTVEKPTVLVRALLFDLLPGILAVGLVLAAAAAIAAALIGRTLARPLEALTAFAERVSEGEYRAALPVQLGNREVTRLSSALDSMRRQLQGRPFVEAFAADLSHELKNPVAAIRASAEVLEDGALENPDDARRFVARIREAVGRIERLLSELLALARIEARGVEVLDWVDLGALVQQSARLADVSGSRVELQLASCPRIRGDATWLARAVDNLLSNALEHSPPGSPVRVRLQLRDTEVVLAVHNEGRFAQHIRAQLFRRFVTTRAHQGGTGLGLALARAVADAHRGRVELVSAGPPEVELLLALPRA